MKNTVRRLVLIHVAVLLIAAVGSALVWGVQAALASVCGVVCFSVPVVIFSLLVLRASAGEQSRFWRRFMTAEVLKWLTSAGLLAAAFASGVFKGEAQPLLAGFILSVLVQVFFPIFVQRESKA